MASSSGEHVPGNDKQTREDAKPRLSQTQEMLQQSSKCWKDDDDDVIPATPTVIEKTPGKLSSVAPTPPERPIEIDDSPEARGSATPKSKAKKRPRTCTPASASRSPGSVDVKRQLFGPKEMRQPKKAVTAPKPEGYWRSLGLGFGCCLLLAVCICKPSFWAFRLRVRRHFTPNSKGEINCSPRILEMGKTTDGRALPISINTQPPTELQNTLRSFVFYQYCLPSLA